MTYQLFSMISGFKPWKPFKSWMHFIQADQPNHPDHLTTMPTMPTTTILITPTNLTTSATHTTWLFWPLWSISILWPPPWPPDQSDPNQRICIIFQKKLSGTTKTVCKKVFVQNDNFQKELYKTTFFKIWRKNCLERQFGKQVSCNNTNANMCLDNLTQISEWWRSATKFPDLRMNRRTNRRCIAYPPPLIRSSQ